MFSTATQLKNEIIAVFNGTSGQFGSKLRTEDEIALSLEVPKHRVRQALGSLRNEGLLISKRGSGTYLRKLPGDGNRLNRYVKSNIDPEKIFETDTNEIALNGWAKKSSRLSLSLWGDLEYISAAKQLELSGMVKQVQESGHRLSIHSMVQSKDMLMPFNVLRAQVHEHLYDGYIVTNRWADTFDNAFEGIKAPVVYVDINASKTIHQPLVFQDTYGAIELAIEQFANIGYKRIAYLGYMANNAHQENAVFTYNKALDKAGLFYRMESHTDVLCISSEKEAMLKLLDANDRPEAIYVSDDFLMPGVVEAMKTRNVIPGKDMAIITLSNKNLNLPSDYNWSVMQFDHELLGRTAADMLIRMLTGSNLRPCNLGLRATWIEGQTHLIKN